jgi:lipoprotein-releasing system permease protein
MKYMLDLKPNEYSACEIRLDSTLNNRNILNQIKNYLGDAYVVKTRYEQNQSLFAAMQIEKWVIFAVTALILMVAAFNIIGALTMLVLEKQKDIGVLKALGATSRLIQEIFLCEGILLSFIGGFIGMAIATIVCLLQLKFHLITLEGGTFVINYYPVKILWTDYLLVFVTIFIIAIIAAWLPASKAGKESLSLKV